MSSKFAKRRMPRKIGGDDEEDDAGVPGMCTMTFFVFFGLFISFLTSAKAYYLHRTRCQTPN
jgi:hypothetical protein